MARAASPFSHERLDLFQPVCPLITRQAVKEYFPVLLAHQSLVQDGENAAVFPAANQPAKSLLQRDDGLGDLIIGEGTAPVFVDQADPVVAARIRLINEDGGSAFTDYQVPQAVIALKQGLGRLIRSRKDRGILAILDQRLVRKQYGKIFFDSLPGYQRANRLEEVKAFMREC